MTQTLGNDKIGALAYTLYVDGQIVETVSPEEPIEYLHGAQNIVSGLEEALVGKTIGDKFTVELAPDQAYGEYDPEDVEDVPAEEFEDIEDLKVGMEIEVMDEDGDFIEATIIGITEEYVRLDYNPALAGKTLRYDVQVVDVRDASEEELEMGVPESLFGELYDEYDEEDEEEDDHRH
jgi:FKBP-type peptidyl-prolyl cis-trans isomerase SlyD